MELKKYDKIYLLGHEENKDIFLNPEQDICLQEKVDGANFRVYITEDLKVIFGSRTQQLTSDNEEDTNVEKNFKRAVNYVREMLVGKDLKLIKNTTLFMECMVRHTIDYNWDITPPAIGFDIYNNETAEYVNWKMAKDIFESFGFVFVPIVKECKIKDLTLPITDEMVPISKYTNQQAEGIVFKTLNPKIYAKYVRNEFKEKNAEVFGGKNVRYNSEDDSGKLIGKYCTNYRIEKNILKLIDLGEKLDMPLMAKLPNLVYKDIWEENWQEILFMKDTTINFYTFRKLNTKRCLVVLKQMITNNALNK